MPGKSHSQDEERLATDWWANDGIAPSEIAQRLRRNKSTITRLLFKRKGERKKRGPCRRLTEAQIDALVTKMKALQGVQGFWEFKIQLRLCEDP